MNPSDFHPKFSADPELEALSRMQPPAVNLSREELDRLAALALMLTQEEFRRNPHAMRFMSKDILIPYGDRPETTRAASRTTVLRVLQALVMLGYLPTEVGP